MWSSRVASAIPNGKVESKDDRSHIMVLAKFAKAARGVMKRGAVGRGVVGLVPVLLSGESWGISRCIL